MTKNILLIVLAAAVVAEGVVLGLDHSSRDSELVALRASDQKYRHLCNDWSSAVHMYGTWLVDEPAPQTTSSSQAIFDALLGETFLRSCDVPFPKLAHLLHDADNCWVDSGRGDCYAKVLTEFDNEVPIYLW